MISYLFLFQNWAWAWNLRIDPPAWSMATETQIYLIFAFLLLPLARRVGVAGAALIALWAGLEIHRYFNAAYDYVYESYVGLFALGDTGRVHYFSIVPWADFAGSGCPGAPSPLSPGLAWPGSRSHPVSFGYRITSG